MLEMNHCEPSNLTQSKVYWHNQTLYKYIYKDDKIKSTGYYFRPLSGQRKRTDLKLNASKIYTQVFEVPSLYGLKSKATATSKYVQLSLF